MHFGAANRENVNRNAIFLDYMTDELHGKKYPFFIKASMYPEQKEKGGGFFILKDILLMFCDQKYYPTFSECETHMASTLEEIHRHGCRIPRRIRNLARSNGFPGSKHEYKDTKRRYVRGRGSGS